MEIARVMMYLLGFGGAVLIFVFHKRLERVFHWVSLFFFFAAVSQFTAYLIIPFIGSNVVFYHLVMIINYFLIFCILFHLLTTPQYRKLLMVIFGTAGIAFFYLLFSVFSEQFASRALTVLNISVIAGCLLFFYELLSIPESLSITRQGKFWIATAFLVYHVATFFLWIIFELLEFHGLYSMINIGLVLLFYTLLILAVFIQLHNQHYVKHQQG